MLPLFKNEEEGSQYTSFFTFGNIPMTDMTTKKEYFTGTSHVHMCNE